MSARSAITNIAPAYRTKIARYGLEGNRKQSPRQRGMPRHFEPNRSTDL